MASTVIASTTSLPNKFKVKYDKKSYYVFNTATPLLQKIRRETGGFNGKNKTIDAVLGFKGGVSSGSLPKSNVQSDENAVLTRKKLYSTISIDREAMYASKDDGAFEDLQKDQFKQGVKSFVRNMSRQLFAYENGKLFEGDGATTVTGAGSTGSPYLVKGLSSTWVKSFIEKKDYVNVDAETTDLEITAVDFSTRVVSLVGTSATLAAAVSGVTSTTAKIYMQYSKDNDIQSILAATKQTSSTLYGVSIGARWQSVQTNAASATLTTDLMNQCVSDVEFQSGESPDLIVTSYKQLRKLKNLLGDKVRYMVVGHRDPNFRKAGASFQAIEFMTDSGPVPIVADRMCPDDHMFFLNTDYIVLHSLRAPEWVDEDGSTLLRSTSDDAFDARYAWYGQLFIHPNAHGVLYNLA